MHRAKGDRFVRASELPVCDNANFGLLFESQLKTGFTVYQKLNKTQVSDLWPLGPLEY